MHDQSDNKTGKPIQRRETNDGEETRPQQATLRRLRAQITVQLWRGVRANDAQRDEMF